jgi:hypothetical protein
MESLEEDLGKLDFVRESEIWKSGYIRDYLNQNPYINIKPYKFNNVYSLESAKRVYEYNKKQFIICDYDPFSFTRQELSNEEFVAFAEKAKATCPVSKLYSSALITLDAALA